MAAPNNVVFVRHGESEANVLQEAEDNGQADMLPQELRLRPDWMHRLTPKGVAQAMAAGRWLTEQFGPIEEYFDGRYSSAFVRARETASYLGKDDGLWRPHSMLHERDWGEYGITPHNEQEARFAYAHHMKKVAPLYAVLPGGESLANDVALRVRNFKATLFDKDKWEGKNVLTVTHGDVINVVRYIFEEMLPEQWHDMKEDKTQRIGNCAILWYTRTNPEDAEDVRPYLNWRKMVQPDDEAKSPFGGEWQEVQRSRIMTAAELRASAERIPRLLPNA